MLAILNMINMAEQMSGTSVKIIKNEVGYGDDTVPKTVDRPGSRAAELELRRWGRTTAHALYVQNGDYYLRKRL